MTADEGVQLYNSWDLTDEQKKDAQVVWAKFDAHMQPTCNFRVERLALQRLKQRPDESFDDFLSRLNNQAAKCKFQDKQERILKQLTYGTKYAEIQKTLL